jgi:predicted nucleic acid-binding protein
VRAKLSRSRSTLVTTSLVVAESHGLIVRRCGHAKGLDFLKALDEPAAQRVVWADPELVRAARANWIIRHTDKLYSLTDAVSFEVMAREGIRDAFAFDLDFERAGFRLLREGR